MHTLLLYQLRIVQRRPLEDDLTCIFELRLKLYDFVIIVRYQDLLVKVARSDYLLLSFIVFIKFQLALHPVRLLNFGRFRLVLKLQSHSLLDIIIICIHWIAIV